LGGIELIPDELAEFPIFENQYFSNFAGRSSQFYLGKIPMADTSHRPEFTDRISGAAISSDPHISSLLSDDQEWADRCQYWSGAVQANTPKRKRRERQSQPMILAGHGMSITIDKSTLRIRDGNTHFPAGKSEHRFFKGDLNLPPRLVLIDGSGAITLDAMDWLAEQKVDLIRLSWDGQIAAVLSASGYAADKKKVAWQVATRANETKRVAFAVPLISKKIKEALFNLKNILPASPSRDKAIDTAHKMLAALKQQQPRNISKLLLAEGQAAAGYFFAWRALPLKWKGTGRYPIPDDWKRFFSRSTLKLNVEFGNRYATHPVNAMLNYAYAVLESMVRVQAIADGYDPTLGIMHTSYNQDRSSFVFDLMEPSRPVVDRIILKLVTEETFSGNDFLVQKDGVCRLNPELARHIGSQVGALTTEGRGLRPVSTGRAPLPASA
jgi:CRISPR-associated protein Cas1